jgi:23S rRNA (cytidine1920-2'-O)/16S rRNA (cytidine1409-2'-O)-methyltransferase
MTASQARTTRQRLDVLLCQRGLVESRQKAQALILAGEVRVNGERSSKAGGRVAVDAQIEIAEAPRYVSRAGIKLAGALEDFAVDVRGLICLDVGASTGGFTDCLLQHGAARVYAVDVTPQQLAWKLQKDARVVRIARNARHLQPGDVRQPPSLISIDVSFISVAKILTAIAPQAAADATWLILVKPQFELERSDIGKGGLVTDSRLHQKAIERVSAAAEAAGLAVLAVKPSRLTGAKGNQEFFLHARTPHGQFPVTS